MAKERVKDKQDHIVKRYILFLIGLFIASMGVAFSTKAGLGVSPISSVPYSISLVNDSMTFGGWLNLLSCIQIGIQVLILRKRAKPVEVIITLILAFVYGYMTNFSCWLISWFNPSVYPAQFITMIISCFIVGFGIWVQLQGNVSMLPGECMNRAIAFVTRKKYENVKITFDVLYIIVSAIICFVCLHKLVGVREGSIIAAILVGMTIKLYNKLFKKNKWKKEEAPD